uniref:Uncharacterized protein n=1 Tax=Drosophila melanogaster TaxID=7227 RepID=Q0KI29_DROME|nr:uncharacterized protein Dmel_CG33721 [Drosophila melanogaster]ABI31194.1 uncharacterized protein Dmel_CG33721 [Drosophila melanogaster]|eukprot:NP_001036743.1 uncharacterized protein Dmel_CG33721 [Drosophila melanogaster]
MYSKAAKLFVLVIFFGNIMENASKLEFTNFKCHVKDPTYLSFEYCFIKSVNRTYKYISLKANMYEVPITNASAKLQISRRFRSYMPITIAASIDVCKYMAYKKNLANPMLRLFEEITKKYTNTNHKCPYDHDLIIDRLPSKYLSEHFTNILPLPPGDYSFNSIWYSRNIERATISIYYTVS